MKDVLIIAHFCDDFESKGNNRFNYIAELLTKDNFSVELITSDFSHSKKEKRLAINEKSYNYKITVISEPVYKKNVSLKRFYSHRIMGKNLKKYLQERKQPDLIYCAVPSLDVSYVAAEHAKKNNIRFIVDIQDLWPEAFEMLFNIPIISNIIYSPMHKKANYVYNTADEIIAVSQTYLNRAKEANGNKAKVHSIFIGTELKQFDAFASNETKPKDEVWLAYIGTLGHSYDLTCVIDALAILKTKGITNLKFIIMGDGPLRKNFEMYAQAKGIYHEFTGRLSYPDMVALLTKCDIAVNPIVEKSAASIINKHADYAAAGLPILNTQKSTEYKDLINQYNAGCNCDNNPQDLAEKLLILYKDEALRLEQGKNHRKMAEEKFDRANTYPVIKELLSCSKTKHCL